MRNILGKRWLLEIILLVLLALAPAFLSEFRLNLLGKFLSFAILALGLDLIWGYTGILSLGHGVFFGLGAYSMAMYLKLEAGAGKLPDFMVWSGLEILPWFWKPFQNPWFAMIMAVVLPLVLAIILGWFTFRNRIKGVYFSILSQALALIFVIFFIGQQPYTGGTNGITNFKTILGYPLAKPSVQLGLYFITLLFLSLALLFTRWITQTRLGRILEAIRDGENRVRFSGYNPVIFKVFAFAVSAGLAGLAGALFVPQVGIISPVAMGIVPSIEIVIWVAVGGRGTLIGAVLGAILVNAFKSLLSESFPDAWLYALGILFVSSVVLFPDGIVGWWRRVIQKYRPKALPDYSKIVPKDVTNVVNRI